jgi:Uma2 family endonuclease
MSAVSVLPRDTLSETPPRKRFTRNEVERMIHAGFFEGQRYELIDGDLIDKMGQDPPHAFSIQLVLRWLASFVEVGRIRVQLSLEAAGEDRDISVPEPDVAVLAEWKAEYQSRHPRGDEFSLVVEVSDTRLAFDLSRKSAIYARAGVPEYWVLDLVRRLLIVHRQPEGALYRLVQTHSEDDIASIEGRTESVKVAELLPRRS